MRTKVQRRIPNQSREREQLYRGRGGTGGACMLGRVTTSTLCCLSAAIKGSNQDISTWQTWFRNSYLMHPVMMSDAQSFQVPSHTLTIKIVFPLHTELNFLFLFFFLSLPWWQSQLTFWHLPSYWQLGGLADMLYFPFLSHTSQWLPSHLLFS